MILEFYTSSHSSQRWCGSYWSCNNRKSRRGKTWVL